MLHQEIETKLNPEQAQAVRHGTGSLLVLAGAGSGKTRIVTHRIAHLIESGVHPTEIVAVTFTNKAASEMKRRLERLVMTSALPIVATFHALGARILRESIGALGLACDFTIYDDEGSCTLIKRSLQELNFKGEEADVKAMRQKISSAKSQCLSVEEMRTEYGSDLPAHFYPLYTLYENRLREANAVDFDDLLYLTVRLLREKREVLEEYQRRWRFFLIDEYQDTNHAQYLLTNLLVGKTQNLFVVGDPDQAIYSWRGANIHNILNFEKDYPGAKIVRLEQNYRSAPTILDAANSLIAHNRSRYPKKLWSDKVGGEKIGLFVAASERDEAAFVAEELYALHRQEGIPLSEMAILYRTNFQSRSFEDCLLRHRLPYTIVGGLSFYHRKEIRDILAFLQMVISDRDYLAFARTINLPKRGIGGVTLEKIRQGALAEGLSLIDFAMRLVRLETSVMKLSEKQNQALSEYLSTLSHLRSLVREATPTLSLEALVRATIIQTQYLNVLKEEPDSFEERKANLDEFIGKAAEYDLMHEEPSLVLFLEELSLKSAVDAMGTDQERITLMTLHHGKGLEFDAVFLVGMEEDLFPHANAKINFESIEEERRLCYVGMTRAKKRLYLTAAENRFLWGTQRKMRPSRFLQEIPRQHMDRIV